MGSNDIPPDHIPKHVVPLCAFLLQIGGGLWTLAYIFYARESFKSKSYGMPMFALAINFSWEVVYAIFVTESPLEKTVFMFWLVLDCFMVYGMIKYAHHEWSHSPVVARNIVSIFSIMALVGIAGQWAFAHWWIENNIGRREGKFYRGVVGPDTTELGFWSALLAQAYLSAASLCQIIVRQHTGGVSWTIWALRLVGSVVGFYIPYGWQWYFWNEAHQYVANPFSIFMLAVSLLSDLAYPFAYSHALRTEKILPDGRKVNGSTPQVSQIKDE